MRIKITKCSGEHLWYNNKVGLVCDVIADVDYYRLANDHSRVIRKSDCEIIPEGETTFENAKVGDKVWDFFYGWGKITGVSKNLPYPIRVTYSDGYDEYLVDGRKYDSDKAPTLFWNEIKFVIPVRPKRKVKKEIVRYANVYATESQIFDTCIDAFNNIRHGVIATGVELKGEYEVEE